MREPRLPSQGEKLRGPYLLTPTETMAGRKVRAEHTSSHFVEPMLCLAVSDLPDGSKWEYELKLDGYRAIAVKRCGRILLFSRNGRDFTQRFRPLATFTEAPPVGGWCPLPYGSGRSRDVEIAVPNFVPRLDMEPYALVARTTERMLVTARHFRY
jgi:hypothetical protein